MIVRPVVLLGVVLFAACSPGPDLRFRCEPDQTCADGLICFQEHCYPPAERCAEICDGLGWTCGAVPADSCDCGSCPSAEVCGAGGLNLCGAGTCVPRTCTDARANCGEVTDGCGGVLDCGACEAPATCGGDGRANICTGTCVAESDAALCAQAGIGCGTGSVTDGCGVLRTVDCGGCSEPESCGGGGVAGQCGCTEDAVQVCAAASRACGTWELIGRCPAPSAVNCGSCPEPLSCGGGGVDGECGCTAETDAQLCASLATVSPGCSPSTFIDRCGAERVIECNPCAPPNTCGGGGQEGVCGCTPPTAEEYCGANELTCGDVTVTHCGVSRTFHCGDCPGGLCGAVEPNKCCMPESPQEVCNRLGKECGSFSGTDLCGTPVTVDCGSCPEGGTCGVDNTCSCRALQSSCGSGGACCSGSCDGTCCTPPGGACGAPEECCGASDCPSGSCCLNGGAPSKDANLCCSGLLEGDECCSAPTQSCRSDHDCCGNLLCSPDELCCRPAQETCKSDPECCSGFCFNEVCI